MHDIIPMQNATETIFERLIPGYDEDRNDDPLNRLLTNFSWPQAWRQHLGAALKDYLEGGDTFMLNDFVDARHCCMLMANVELSVEDWLTVLDKIPLGTHLARSGDLNFNNRLEALSNIVQAGVDIDHPFAALRDGTKCSLLLAAAAEGDIDTVLQLLQFGADFGQTISQQGVEVGVKELAAGHEQILALFAS